MHVFVVFLFFFSSRRRHTRFDCDWSSDCSSDLYLILLHTNGLIDEALAYIRARVQDPPPGEVLLCVALAEIACATGNWVGAYSLALSVLSRDMNNFRALLISSLAGYELGNIHESLGYAIRAHRIAQAVPAVSLQLNRCQNKIGDYYAAIADRKSVV